MKTPEPWECEGKRHTFKDVNDFIKHLHKVIDDEISKVFGGSGYKGRDCPVSVYIGNSMTHYVSHPFWMRKYDLIETQEEILDEFRCLGNHGMSVESEKLASLLANKLEWEKKETDQQDPITQ